MRPVHDAALRIPGVFAVVLDDVADAQRFDARLVEGYVPKPQWLVTLRPSEGLPMRLGVVGRRSGDTILSSRR